MAIKHKLFFDNTLEQYISLLIPSMPKEQDWSIAFDMEVLDTSRNNGIFSKFTDGATYFHPYLVLESAGIIREVSSGGNTRNYGSGLDFSGRMVFKMEHFASSPDNVVFSVNDISIDTASTFKDSPQIDAVFGLIRNASGQSSFYYAAELYSITVVSSSFNETWDANLLTSTGNKTVLPSLSGSRDANLPNGAQSIAYDDSGVNNAPVAALGANQTITTGVEFTADASGSSDIDNDALTYSATLQAPQGSSATLQDANTENPRFTPDIEGEYVLTLVVNDGQENSAPTTQTLTATQSVDAITMASDFLADLGTTVSLQCGLSSEVTANSWAITSAPNGSTAVIPNPNVNPASFTPDVTGLYEATVTATTPSGNETGTYFFRVREAISQQTPVASIGVNGEFSLNEKITLIAKGEY